MTTPTEQEQLAAVPPVDPGNLLLAATPAQLSCTLVPTDDGQRMLLTIRTSSTTLTVMLNKQDAKQWASTIDATANGMSALILGGPGGVPGMARVGG